MIEIARAGPIPGARIRGMLTGINEVIALNGRTRVIHIDGDGQFATTLKRVRRHLRASKAKSTLVGAANDPSALGALCAFQEAGRAVECAVVSHNAEPEGRAELRQPHTRLIGSVGYFPEKYGARLIRLALDILERRPVPPAVFMKHQLITPENVEHFYPNDALLALAESAPHDEH